VLLITGATGRAGSAVVAEFARPDEPVRALVRDPAGVRHVVKFSGQDSVDGFDPERFRSTRSHEQVQRYLRASGPDWTMLRPSQFMQAYLEEAPAVARSGELRLPLGATTLAPVDIADVADVAYRILTTPGHQGRTYRMTGPEVLTMVEVADRIAAAAAFRQPTS
jgi:uncharacterized protein YbjT (DUF2867 family)